jgi:phosphonoacetate hydrolase
MTVFNHALTSVSNPASISLHGRDYALPTQPVVVICIDGCDPEYIEHGIKNGVCPTIASFIEQGFIATADCVMPSFTNPNNVSIVTGVAPAIHGISGNYYLEPDTKREIMITDATLLRGSTLLGLMSQAGVPTAAITAKDKLRKILGHELDGVCFSTEKAASCTLAEHGIDNIEALVGRPAPDMYSPDLSLYVLDAGLELLRQGRARLLYLSLSDYVQHKYAPGTPESDDFLRAIDQRLQAFIDLGAIVGCVADHGMSDKSSAQGQPNVIFLQDILEQEFGLESARVICPITDPFVRHHGALGSFVRVYVRDQAQLADMLRTVRSLPGVELVMTREEAAAKLELPADREGDFLVVSLQDYVLGSRAVEHDLSTVSERPLRSHGGFSEQAVPFLLSHPLTRAYRAIAAGRRLRNFDIFDFALNGVVSPRPSNRIGAEIEIIAEASAG